MSSASEDTKRQLMLKQQAYLALEDLPHASGVALVCGVVLLALIVLNVVLIFVSSEIPDLVSPAWTWVFLCFSIVTNTCFAVEYCARIWIADLVRPRLSSLRARLRYVFSPMGLVDLLAFLPSILALLIPGFSALYGMGAVMRLARLIKISRYMRGLRSIKRVFMKRRSEIVAAFMVLGLLTVMASVLMHQVENPVQPENFDSLFTGMYWAMTTITSTGYGDLVPITAAGRFIGFVTMVLSIGVVAIPAGIFSAGFVAEFRAQDARAQKQAQENEHLEGAEPEGLVGSEEDCLDTLQDLS